MKVFRKELYKKAMGRTEEVCIHCKWPLECDGAVVSKTGAMYGRDGYEYSASDAWCEEVTDLDCQSDVDAMKDWKIGTEHVIRKNGKDVRVVVSHFEIGKNACNECALAGACYGNAPCLLYERTTKDEVYFKEVKEHKPLVLKLFFSPERNMTFTEHDINPEVGFVTGKYYRFIGKESDTQMTLYFTMHKILEHKVLKCTNGSGRKANFEGIGDLSNDLMYTWMYDGDEKEAFLYWKEMRPLVVLQEPDIITFDECITSKGGSLTGESKPYFRKLMYGDWGSVFDSVTGRADAEQGKKEKPNMKVDENFTFKKKYVFGTTLHEPKVVKTHKAYANDGACEACGAIISKGSFVLTANETDCNRVTKKTHRLCASCTAKYINVRMDVEKGWWSVPYYAMEVIKETAKEPTYAERQAQWVKENNVRVGTKVRVIRTFTSCEDGCNVQFTPLKGTFIGDDCTVDTVLEHEHDACIIVRSKQKDDWWQFPYFVLEVLPEEPWFKIGDKVRITIKSSVAYNKIGTVTNVHMHKDGTQSVYMNFAEFCGTKAFNADSKEKIGELYVPSYKELQDAWIAKHNLKEGDKVVILRTAKDRENGWPNNWCDTMNNKVGQMHTVDSASETGVRLSCGYQWPYFVLGVVKE